MRRLVVLLFAVGCGTSAPDDDCSHLFYVDDDGDGHGATTATATGCVAPPGFETTHDDCDDGDATIHPEAPERCNDVDDDCDGSIDVDPVDGGTWYADLDGDGHGDPLESTTACSIPLGYASAGDDCDDTDAAIHGDASEVCNELDDDCDGSIDVDAIDAPIWYADEDGDGYGDPTSITAWCSLPPEYSPTNDDCDDDDAAVHPGAVEVCNDFDDDCEGTTDLDAADMPTWYADADGDGHGDPAVSIATCSTPTHYTESDDDCDDADATIFAGADEICNAVDDDCDALIDLDDPGVVDAAWYEDADGDGYGDPAGTASIGCEAPTGMVPDATDCDDSSADVSPDAEETCNGIDDDCDALTDDDDTSASGREFFSPDGDGDGVGGGSLTVLRCVAPSGYGAGSDDCDDTDATVAEETTAYKDGDGDGYGGTEGSVCGELYGWWVLTPGDCDDSHDSSFPGATEVCDERDDNCDGLIDEDDPLVVWATMYADVDGDGYGDDGVTIAESCDTPSGYAAVGGDCEDGDSSIYPTAPEYCDEKDNDCNGSTDDGVVYADYYADADGDGFGVTDDTVNDCVPPEGYSLAPGDCNDDRAHAFPGATETCGNGADDDCDGIRDNCLLTLDDADVVLTGPTVADAYVGSWVGAADLDADGTADVITSNGPYGSGLLVVFGPRSGELSADDADLSSDPSVWSNRPVATGDADGDGDDDLFLVGDWDSPAYLLLGPMTSGSDVTTADVSFEQSTGWSDTVTVVPDHDGDGSPDVVVTSVDYGGRRQRGTVYVAPGDSTGTVDLDAEATYVYRDGPSTSRDELGASIAALGDTTGDGIEDLAVGAPGSDTQAVWVVEGGAPPGTYVLTDTTCLASLTSARTDFGTSLAASDSDGDGYGDLFVGAPGRSPAVYGFSGPFAEARDTGDADVRWIGESSLGWWRIAADGDVDADGLPDLLFRGSSLTYLQVGEARGVVDVAELPSFRAAEYGPPSFAFLPDWTGDGGSELLLGDPSFAIDDDVPGRVGVISSETLY